jgi:TolB protein
LAWSPDGSTLAFNASTPDGSPQIYVMDADGSSVRKLTGSGLGAAGPRWSPDGSRIAFLTVSQRHPISHVYTMASDGSDVRAVEGFPSLTEAVVGDGIAWNPVG